MKEPHFAFYGHFGVGNLGNDTTFESALFGARKVFPHARITCVCRGPSEISKKYGIAVLPVDIDEDRRPGKGRSPRFNRNIFLRIFNRITDELYFWIHQPKWFREVDQFIVVGTGAIHDGNLPPWNVPYDLFKWCLAARLGGATVVFMSVGAGPINNPVSRLLLLQALRMGAYRSYRDKASFRFLASVGFDTRQDRLYPDVVFSLPVEGGVSNGAEVDSVKRVGLGVIAYYGGHGADGESIYRAYIAKLKSFATWLLSEGYDIRLLTGDLENDPRPAQELVYFIQNQTQPGWSARVIFEPMANAQDLHNQILKTDIVIASRFHNLVAALMAGRPVISIGFHEKNDSLMEDFGLSAYCQHIEELDTDKLIVQFNDMKSLLVPTSLNIQSKVIKYRESLDEQYQTVFSALRSSKFKSPIISQDRYVS